MPDPRLRFELINFMERRVGRITGCTREKWESKTIEEKERYYTLLLDECETWMF